MVEASSPMIEVKDLTFKYDMREPVEALSSINFTIYKGEWVAIIGNNGSGKSTLANILIGLLTPQYGEVKINGIELNENNKWKIRQQMGIVFQNPDNQFIGTTVEDDVAFGLENLNLPYDEMKIRVDKAIREVGMEDFRHADPSRLSGGQKQRVAIAGLLALQPKIILLDEAFVMLDPRSRKELLNTIQQLKKEQNLTIISITHDMNEAASSDRIILMEDGHISATGAPKDVFTNEIDFEAPFSERLRRTLLKKGRPVQNRYMTEDEMIRWLMK